MLYIIARTGSSAIAHPFVPTKHVLCPHIEALLDENLQQQNINNIKKY